MEGSSTVGKPPRRRRWYIIALVLVAVVGVWFLFGTGSAAPVPEVTFELQDELSIELVDMLHGSHTEFQPGEPFNPGRYLADKLPARVTYQLMKWNIINPHTTFRGSLHSSGWSARISDPDSLGLVFRLKAAGELARLLKTDIRSAMDRITKITEPRSGTIIRPRYRVMLSSPDSRYVETANLQINQSYGSTGTVGSSSYDVRYEPYAHSPFHWVAPNYPELDLTLLKGSEKAIESSTTVRIKNPLFRKIPAPAPVQTLPATAEKDGVTLTLERVIGDGAQHTRGRRSMGGDSGEELYRSGTILKADSESREEAQTYIKAQILEDGMPSTAWGLSQEEFLFGDGTRLGSGTGLSNLGDGYYVSGSNVAVAGGPVKMRLTVRREADFLADEITTLSLPLPPKGEAVLLNQIVNFWNGEVNVKGIGNQYAKSKAPYNNLFAPESIKLHVTGPVGHNSLKLHSIALSDGSTSLPLNGNSTATWGPSDKEARYEFKTYVNFSTTKIDTSPYTTVTVVLTAPRKIGFEFIVEPEVATVPVEPIEASRWW